MTGYSHLNIIHTIGIFTDVLSGDNRRDGIYTAGEAMRSVRRGEWEGASLDVQYLWLLFVIVSIFGIIPHYNLTVDAFRLHCEPCST